MSIRITDTSSTALSYFDQMRLEYQTAPFEDERAKANFSVKLSEWGALCDSNREVRRDFYRVEQFFTLEQVPKLAGYSTMLTSKDGKRAIRVHLVRQPINQFETDALINAANETLLGGGGADQETHDGAGPNLVKECAYHNGCGVGEAVLTKGYDLPAKYVVHTVGPLLNSDDSGDELALTSCYANSLTLCDRFGLESVVAPCVACGFYAYPLADAATVVKKTLQGYLESGSSTVKTVILSVPKETEWEAYYKEFQQNQDIGG